MDHERVFVVHDVVGIKEGLQQFKGQMDGHTVVLLKNQRKHFSGQIVDARVPSFAGACNVKDMHRVG